MPARNRNKTLPAIMAVGSALLIAARWRRQLDERIARQLVLPLDFAVKFEIRTVISKSSSDQCRHGAQGSIQEPSLLSF